MTYSIQNYHGSKVMVFYEDLDSRYVAQQLSIYKDLMNDDDSLAVVNLKKLVNRYNEWCDYLPRVKPYYAVKCNDDPVILRTLACLGCGFDCASKFEIEQAIKVVSPENIIYANPCKTPNYIKYASKIGVDHMTFDNEEELYKIKDLHSQPKLILRIFACDPSAQLSLGKKFGCDPIFDAPYLLKKAKLLGLECVGISFHVGSGCNDPYSICNAIKESKRLFEIGNEIGHKMAILDIGGGFPGKNQIYKTPFHKMAEIIRTSLDLHFPLSYGVKIIAEPGRYFATSAVSIAVKIIAATQVKAPRITENYVNPEDPAYMYYVNDGCFGSFNCILTDNYFPEGRSLFDLNENQEEYLSCVWGPTCDGQDKMEVKNMQKMNVGDWLIYSDMGAYTKTTSSYFNGFQPAKYHYFADQKTWTRICGKKPISNRHIDAIRRLSMKKPLQRKQTI